jgi:hypothetical protein
VAIRTALIEVVRFDAMHDGDFFISSFLLHKRYTPMHSGSSTIAMVSIVDRYIEDTASKAVSSKLLKVSSGISDSFET